MIRIKHNKSLTFRSQSKNQRQLIFGIWIVIDYIFCICVWSFLCFRFKTTYISKYLQTYKHIKRNIKVSTYQTQRITILTSSNNFFRLKYASAILSGLILTCCITFTIYDSRNEVERLIAIAGLILFIVVGFAVSNNKAKVKVIYLLDIV